jgi:hypothetical protein
MTKLNQSIPQPVTPRDANGIARITPKSSRETVKIAYSIWNSDWKAHHYGGGYDPGKWDHDGLTYSDEPTFIPLVVTVSGGKFLIDGQEQATLNEGSTYRFDQSDSSNNGHPLRLSTVVGGTHNSGVEYTNGVTYNGVPGTSDAYTEIVVIADSPVLYYYCSVHNLMGGTAFTTPDPYYNSSATLENTYSINWYQTYDHSWGIEFSTDGTKMFIGHDRSGSGWGIRKHELSTAWDISTAADSDTHLPTIGANFRVMKFKPDGTAVYYVSSTGNRTIIQYNLSTAWDLTTRGSLISANIGLGDQDNNPRDLLFDPTGTILYMVNADVVIYKYTLSTPWDVSTLTYSTIALTGFYDYSTSSMGIEFNNDGTKLFVLGASANQVKSYTLSPAYDVSTATYDGTNTRFLLPSADYSSSDFPTGFAYGKDGEKLYVINRTTVRQYNTLAQS